MTSPLNAAVGQARRAGRPLAMPLEERRTAIFAASERLFGERGYDNVTMADIAAACGMSRKTLYVLFADKDDLLRKLIGSSYAAAAADEDMREAAGDPIDNLRRRLRIMVDHALSQRHINLRRIAIAERWEIGSVARMFHEAGVERSRDKLIHSLSHVDRSLRKVALPDPVLADMLYGATCGYALMSALLVGASPDPEQAYRTIDILLDGLFMNPPRDRRLPGSHAAGAERQGG